MEARIRRSLAIAGVTLATCSAAALIDADETKAPPAAAASSQLTIDAPLTQFVALKFSYIVRFDNLPAPGFKKTDTFFTSGIQVAF